MPNQWNSPPRGESHGNARLTDDAVRAIRQRYAAGGISQDALAHEYGMGQTQISGIIRHHSR